VRGYARAHPKGGPYSPLSFACRHFLRQKRGREGLVLPVSERSRTLLQWRTCPRVRAQPDTASVEDLSPCPSAAGHCFSGGLVPVSERSRTLLQWRTCPPRVRAQPDTDSVEDLSPCPSAAGHCFSGGLVLPVSERSRTLLQWRTCPVSERSRTLLQWRTCPPRPLPTHFPSFFPFPFFKLDSFHLQILYPYGALVL